MSKEYRQILRDSRKSQLRLSATNVERMRVTFDAATESIRQRIADLPDHRVGTPWHRAQLQLLADVRTVLDGFRRDYTSLLDVGMIELAQNAADREAAVAILVAAPVDPTLLPVVEQTVLLTNGQNIPVKFGRLALGAVERVTTRYYRDGLKLSDRIHNLDGQARKVVEDVLIQGITEQISAVDMAKRLQETMQVPRHIAMRISRSELRAAHVEAHLMSCQSSPGLLKEYISGVRYNMSLSHPESDICDLYASRDAGLGPGVYLPAEFPISHPNCMCYSSSQLVAFPESGIGGAKPNPDSVPDNQRRRFAEEFPSASQGVLVPA